MAQAVALVGFAVALATAIRVMPSLWPSTQARLLVRGAVACVAGALLADVGRTVPALSGGTVTWVGAVASAAGLALVMRALHPGWRTLLLDSWLAVACLVLVGYEAILLVVTVPGDLPGAADVGALTLALWQVVLAVRLVPVLPSQARAERGLLISFWVLRAVGWLMVVLDTRFGFAAGEPASHWFVGAAYICLAALAGLTLLKNIVPVPISRQRGQAARWPYLVTGVGAVVTMAGLPHQPQLDRPMIYVLATTCALALVIRQVFTLSAYEDLYSQSVEQENHFRSLVQDSTDVVMICSPDGMLDYVSPSGNRVLGASTALEGRALGEALSLDDEVVRTAMATLAEGRKSVQLDGRRGDRVLEGVLSPRGAGYLVSVRDVTEQHRLRSRLQYLAYHDGLTGLPNRGRVLQHLDAHAKAAQVAEDADTGEHLEPLAVLFVDLDRFKQVNDASGHAIGDDVLRQVARRFEKLTRGREGTLLGRIGGDEFVVVAPGDEVQAVALAEAFHAATTAPFDVDGRSYQLGASVGIAFTAAGISSDDVLGRADVAMYSAKRELRRWMLYSPGLGDRAVERAASDLAVATALRHGEIAVYLQPLVDVPSGLVEGTEALLRWRRADGTIQGPADMLEYAYRTGQMGALTASILETSIGLLEQHPMARIAVNMPPVVLSEPDLAGRIAMILEDYHVSPGRLEFEITEDQLIEAARTPLDQLAQFRTMGVKVMLDDFGAGFSSFTNLLRLPVDGIKLDRSLVEVLPASSAARSMVRGLVSGCAEMGMTVVAEGIETADQYGSIGDLGVPVAQGFYFARPEPGKKLLDITRLDSWSSANALFTGPDTPSLHAVGNGRHRVGSRNVGYDDPGGWAPA